MFRLLFVLGTVWYACVAQADLYQWIDTDGVIHIVDETVEVPEAYRDQLTVYRTTIRSPALEVAGLPIAPSGTYPANSQGAYAQKIALDLGLIRHHSLDALGPLGGVGIQPAGGWKVTEPLTPDALSGLVAAARRAAEAQRLNLSADGVEAVIRQAAVSFLPPPVQPPPPPLEAYDEEPEVIIIEQPPEVIEVVQEPYYVPAVPVIVGFPRDPIRGPRSHRRDRHGDRRRDHVSRRRNRHGDQQREPVQDGLSRRSQPTIQRSNPTITPSTPQITRQTPTLSRSVPSIGQ